MKKSIVLFFAIVAAFIANAQGVSNVSEVYFYGVDFSKGKIMTEEFDTTEYRKAFANINMLFFTEREKYDVARIIKRKVVDIRIDAVKEANASVSEDIVAYSINTQLPDEKVKASLAGLKIEEQNGTGLVLVMRLLDKSVVRGYYKAVFFDIATRNIIATYDVDGEAGGFGLRNFWASSMLESIKKLGKKMKKE